MAVTLSAAQIDRVVSQAWYVISVSPRVTDTSCLGLSTYFGSDAVYSGEGSKSIAYIQKQIANWPKATLEMDVPVMPISIPAATLASKYPKDSYVDQTSSPIGLQAGANWTKITKDDIEALRQAFITRWGDVYKPNVYADGANGADVALPGQP